MFEDFSKAPESSGQGDNFAALRQFFMTPQAIFDRVSSAADSSVEANFGPVAVASAAGASTRLWLPKA